MVDGFEGAKGKPLIRYYQVFFLPNTDFISYGGLVTQFKL
jgi:hypothetical protein